MTFDPTAIMSKLVTIAQASGRFFKVNEFEPRGQPSNGLTLSLISGPKVPIQSSGLTKASIRWQIDGRVYSPMRPEPKDVDAKLTAAAAGYMEALCGQYTLGGLVRCIDVFGSDGEGLNSTPGYLEQDSKLYRVEQIMIPLLINEAWTLTP